ncbi:hypothetical protein Cme02nite_03090 [Catellatospora methionotrophica]|uniref:Uncharacterized protein n=1 Tax=Catellatospora methionotrophica TaxID=121620 RepID=A0A8J3L4I5_9ACTN|nr:hypothetical protein [Catellatospora methionotrophica]GIG11977.1 hypothetical protein Cme02nite_03090 [Catellatospora methionotrophica]
MSVTGRLLTTGAAITAMLLGNAVPASADLVWNDQDFRDVLFVSQVQAQGSGERGYAYLVSSVALLDWRAANPAATVPATVAAFTAIKDEVLPRVLGAFTPQPPCQPTPQKPCPPPTAAADRPMTPSPQGYLLAAIDAAMDATGTIDLPRLRELARDTQGDSLGGTPVDIHQVTGSYQNEVLYATYPRVQREHWAAVSRAGLADSTLAQAWDTVLGGTLSVHLAADRDTLLQGLPAPARTDLTRLLDLRDNPAAFQAEALAQAAASRVALNARHVEATDALKALNAANPPGLPPTTSAEQAATAAANRNKELDGYAATGRLIGTVVGYFDKEVGADIVRIVDAVSAIVKSYNDFGPAMVALAGGSLAGVGAIVAFGQAVVGGVQLITEMFGYTGPAPEQVMIDQIKLVSKQIDELRTTMNARFDHLELMLKTMFEEISKVLIELEKDIEEIRRNLAAMQNGLLALDERVSQLAASTAAALRNQALDGFVAQVNENLGWETKTNLPLTDFGRYWTAASTFHSLGAYRSSSAPFAIQQNTAPDMTPAAIGEYTPHGSLYYLSWLARHRWDGNFPLPAVNTAQGVPNAGVWIAAARAYNDMTLQNPQFAGNNPPSRATELITAGARIQAVLRSYSAPANGGTNQLFQGLTGTYRTAMDGFSQRLSDIRRDVLPYPNYDIFGDPAQPPPGNLPSSNQVVHCPTSGSPVPAPAVASLANMSRVYHTMYTLASPVSAKVQVRDCYDAVFVNHDTWENSRGEWRTSADVQVTIRLQVKWHGEDAWRDARTMSAVHPAGKIEWDDASGTGMITPQQAVVSKWPQGLRAAMEASTTVGNVAATEDNAWLRLHALQNGKQRLYYSRAVAELRTPNSVLNLAAARVNEAVLLLQTYTQLGFPQASSVNTVLANRLNGTGHLPGSIRLTSGLHSDYLLEPLVAALDAYSNCAAPLGEACPYGDWYSPKGYLDRTPMAQFGTACAPSEVAVMPRDPIGDCLAFEAVRRVNELSAEYRLHSGQLSRGEYVEGIPEIEQMIKELEMSRALLSR